VLDPYLLPNGTLQNRLGTDDPSELLRREDQLVSLRQAVLARKRSSAPFDFDKLGEILAEATKIFPNSRVAADLDRLAI
jgi:hypothetical protein